MHLPVFLIISMILVFLINVVSKRNQRDTEAEERAFREKEQRANTTRRKDISNLDFITIPPCLSSPSGLLSEEIAETEKQIAALRDQKIVNFTGITNTDLKLTYGAANIDALSEYDNNYLKLVRLIVKYAKQLIDAGLTEKAKEILEFGVSVKTDVSANYTLLAKLYKDEGNNEKLREIRLIAEQLNSLTKAKLLRDLDDILLGKTEEY
ncbi:MAG: hypothetical protein J6Z46_03325 [Lachnospiraceae bacterium]|nr:hypothetical protein [Lachnospiraceae bacterium]